jgi:glucose-1-phosphate thymidylyltransferase
MLGGIRRVLVITTPHEQAAFKSLLGDGSQWGMELSYAVQPSPDGLAQAFLIGRSFVDAQPCALVLGDNIFYGQGLSEVMQRNARHEHGATVFGYWVKHPEAYGVAELGAQDRVLSIEEKPARPKSNYAVTGLYFYDGQVSDYAASLRPSARGELEITDLNRIYLERGELRLERLSRGFAWLDTGTPEALLHAANFVHAIEARQGLQVACPEEIAFHNGWITGEHLERLASTLGKTAYAEYLRALLTGPKHG